MIFGRHNSLVLTRIGKRSWYSEGCITILTAFQGLRLSRARVGSEASAGVLNRKEQQHKTVNNASSQRVSTPLNHFCIVYLDSRRQIKAFDSPTWLDQPLRLPTTHRSPCTTSNIRLLTKRHSLMILHIEMSNSLFDLPLELRDYIYYEL